MQAIDVTGGEKLTILWLFKIHKGVQRTPTRSYNVNVCTFPCTQNQYLSWNEVQAPPTGTTHFHTGFLHTGRFELLSFELFKWNSLSVIIWVCRRYVRAEVAKLTMYNIDNIISCSLYRVNYMIELFKYHTIFEL